MKKKLAQYPISKHSFLLLLFNIICNYKAWFLLMKFKISEVVKARDLDRKTSKRFKWSLDKLISENLLVNVQNFQTPKLML